MTETDLKRLVCSGFGFVCNGIFVVISASVISPPRPRRVMTLDVHSQQTICDSGNGLITEHHGDADMLLKFEDGLVDRAVSDLPNIASQVFSLNKDQNSEIKRQQKLLTFMQEKVTEGEERVSEIELEIKCIMNKIFMKEEEGKESNKRIKNMDADIKSLITRVIDKEHDVAHIKENADQETRNLQKQLQKAESYRENVEQFEQATSTAYSDLQNTKEEVEELKKQKDIIDKDPEETERLMSGVVEKELASEIEDIKSQLLQEGSEVKLNITKLTEERQKHKQLNQTIQVLHKRNTAQLTRLKRQLKELQTRNRLKQSQLSQLQANIVQAEKQLKQ